MCVCVCVCVHGRVCVCYSFDLTFFLYIFRLALRKKFLALPLVEPRLISIRIPFQLDGKININFAHRDVTYLFSYVKF